ncbi:MAG: transcriptional repressor [Dehalococcoidia bacterium]
MAAAAQERRRARDAQTTDEAIRRHGLRRTVTRALVADVLAAHPGHHSVEEIEALLAAEHPSSAGMARSTVYRVLEALESAGLVVAVRTAQQEARFEWAPDEPHHHLICDRCGTTLEVELSAAHSLEGELRRKYGFEARVQHLRLSGACADCIASAVVERGES